MWPIIALSELASGKIRAKYSIKYSALESYNICCIYGKKNGRRCIKTSTATLSQGFLKADPEMRIHGQVIYYENASRRTHSGSRENETGKGEKAKQGCDFSIMESNFSLLLQGNSGT